MDQIPYLFRRNKSWITFWTSLADLKKDLSNINWSDNVLTNLKKLKSDLCLPDNNCIDFSYLFNEEYKPYSYQNQGINRIIKGPVILADETGLGKTPQALGAAVYLYLKGEIDKGVFVTPAGLKIQWYEEFLNFINSSKFELPNKFFRIVSGTPSQREQIYKNNWKFLIINYKLLIRDYEYLEDQNIGFVALDEASAIRNRKTKTAKTVKRIFKNVPYKVAITATPIENCLYDIYSIFEFIDKRIFPSKKHFEENYCKVEYRNIYVTTKRGYTFPKKIKNIVGYKNLNRVKNKIKYYYIRRSIKDAGIELPSIIVNWVPVELTDRQKKMYSKIKEQTKENEIKKGVALFSILHNLRKSCNSSELIDGRTRSSSKIKKLKEYLDTEIADQKVIIFTEYRTKLCDIFKRELKKYKPTFFVGAGSVKEKRKREKQKIEFLKGNSQVLICTSAGERGLNLQVAPILINFDLPWNPARLKQRIGRICRIGSKFETVRMINLIAIGTVEEKLILKKIYSKRQLFESIVGEDKFSEADPLSNLSVEEIKNLF